jgi:hypothetical protein
MPSPNLSELITTTLRNRTGKLADNVSDNNALLLRLKQRGRSKPAAGGRVLVQELEYAENSTAMWYSGYDQLDIAPSDVITAAEFDWKQCAVAVSISGLEQLQNAGKERVIDWLDARIRNAEKTMTNMIAAGVYATGTGNGGKEIGGLQHLISKTPTSGTVGGINRATATNSFWRNYSRDSSDNSITWASNTIQSEMNIAYLNLVRGTDKPDLIVTDYTGYNFYLSSLQTIQRVTDTSMAQAGFTSLKYMDADVVLDGGQGGNCPAGTMYFLNSDYIHYRPHSDRNMVVVGGDRTNLNQDAIVRIIAWAGNMTLSNAALQGVLAS